ncbi:MAG: cytochrome c [Gammaproteobacteria bacterium]|nr:cytochrome c [Gammaproteobacteria bacterium]MDP2140161.1 cytochrome c [Gammaproteobacteria bacterium]MDP2347119.1 cytochrome c [Gammaproteobacteria bacterium]
MKKTRFAIATLMTVVLGSAAIADAGAAPTSISAGVYTQEQAAAGKDLFDRSCSTCHNADYYKTVFQTWRGQPLMYLFEQVMSAMPADNPGSFSDAEYEDIMAYVLQLTGFPSGAARLQYGGGGMREIAIEPAS